MIHSFLHQLIHPSINPSRYIFRVNKHISVISDKLQPPHNISDDQPHEVSVQRPSLYHNIFRVDDTTSSIASTPSFHQNAGGLNGGDLNAGGLNAGGFNMGGKNSKNVYDWSSEGGGGGEIEMDIYVGGMSGRMYGDILEEMGAKDGYVGCVSSIDLDGHTWPVLKEDVMIEERHNNDIVNGCIGGLGRGYVFLVVIKYIS